MADLCPNPAQGKFTQVNQAFTDEVGNHLMLDPMVEWKQECNQYNFDSQYFPWFTMRQVMDLVICDEDDEFKEKDKREESQGLDGPFRHAQAC